MPRCRCSEQFQSPARLFDPDEEPRKTYENNLFQDWHNFLSGLEFTMSFGFSALQPTLKLPSCTRYVTTERCVKQHQNLVPMVAEP